MVHRARATANTPSSTAIIITTAVALVVLLEACVLVDASGDKPLAKFADGLHIITNHVDDGGVVRGREGADPQSPSSSSSSSTHRTSERCNVFGIGLVNLCVAHGLVGDLVAACSLRSCVPITTNCTMWGPHH
jgi:hypothetical protein